MIIERGRAVARFVANIFDGQFDTNNIVVVGSSLLKDNPKDIDVILEGTWFSVHTLRMRPLYTSYGGARFPAIDIWHLHDSWCFGDRDYGLEEMTLENYLRRMTKGARIAYRRATDEVIAT